MFVFTFKGKKLFAIVWNFNEFHVCKNPKRRKMEAIMAEEPLNPSETYPCEKRPNEKEVSWSY